MSHHFSGFGVMMAFVAGFVTLAVILKARAFLLYPNNRKRIRKFLTLICHDVWRDFVWPLAVVTPSVFLVLLILGLIIWPLAELCGSHTNLATATNGLISIFLIQLIGGGIFVFCQFLFEKWKESGDTEDRK